MKRLLLTGLILFSLTACGVKNQQSVPTITPTSTQIKPTATPTQMFLERSEGFVVYYNALNDTIWLLEFPELRRKPLYLLDKTRLNDIQLFPDGHKIAFRKESSTYDPDNISDIYVGDITGSELLKLTDSKSSIQGFSISPMGDEIVYSQWTRIGTEILHEICLASLDGEIRQITLTERFTQNIQWSPDGKWIAYFDDNKLFIIKPDGSAKKLLLSRTIGGMMGSGRHSLSWSESSKSIFMTMSAGYLVEIEIESGRNRQVTRSNENCEFSSYYSSDSKLLLRCSNKEENWVEVLDLNTHERNKFLVVPSVTDDDGYLNIWPTPILNDYYVLAIEKTKYYGKYPTSFIDVFLLSSTGEMENIFSDTKIGIISSEFGRGP